MFIACMCTQTTATWLPQQILIFFYWINESFESKLENGFLTIFEINCVELSGLEWLLGVAFLGIVWNYFGCYGVCGNVFVSWLGVLEWFVGNFFDKIYMSWNFLGILIMFFNATLYVLYMFYVLRKYKILNSKCWANIFLIIIINIHNKKKQLQKQFSHRIINKNF